MKFLGAFLFVAVINLLMLGLAVAVIVKVLQWLGVL